MSTGNFYIFVFESFLLLLLHLFISVKIIPSYLGNVNKKVEKENVNKAQKALLLFSVSAYIYMILEYFGFKAYLLHIVAAIVVAMLTKNMINPFTLKKWGKDSFRVEEVTDESLIKELSQQSDKKKFEYNGQTYVKSADKYKKYIPVKKPTSKSEFWSGFFAVMVWSFLVLNLVYILKVEMGAPEIMVTLLAFIIAYVLSPFYPDLYSTYLLAKDEEIGFEKFVQVDIAGKKYFGSIEKLTFFKIAIKDYYNDTLITFFHKLFLGAVMTSYPNGRFVTRSYGLSEEGQNLVYEKFSEWIKNFSFFDSIKNISVTRNSPDFAYGVKIRFLVKPEDLSKFGQISDQFDDFMVELFNRNNIDHRTPVLEISMKESKNIKI